MSRKAWWGWTVWFVAELVTGALQVMADQEADRATEQRARQDLQMPTFVTYALIPSAKSGLQTVLQLPTEYRQLGNNPSKEEPTGDISDSKYIVTLPPKFMVIS